MKGKNLYIIIAVAVVVVLGIIGGGAYYLLSGSSNNSSSSTNFGAGQTAKKLTPSDIGLTLKVRPDGKGIIMTVSKLNNVKTIEYEVSYNALETEEGQEANVPKGVVASPISVNGQSSITRNLDLGTCSRNVCRFDKVTSPIKFDIKVTYNDGTIGAVETTLNLK